MTQLFSITSGPSKWDLMQSLFERKPLGFQYDGGRSAIEMRIQTLHKLEHGELNPWLLSENPAVNKFIETAPSVHGGWLLFGEVRTAHFANQRLNAMFAVYDERARKGMFVLHDMYHIGELGMGIDPSLTWKIAAEA